MLHCTQQCLFCRSIAAVSNTPAKLLVQQAAMSNRIFSEAGIHQSMQRCLPHDRAAIEYVPARNGLFCYEDAYSHGIDSRQCYQCCMQHFQV
jgi:hypothetical protein